MKNNVVGQGILRSDGGFKATGLCVRNLGSNTWIRNIISQTQYWLRTIGVERQEFQFPV